MLRAEFERGHRAASCVLLVFERSCYDVVSRSLPGLPASIESRIMRSQSTENQGGASWQARQSQQYGALVWLGWQGRSPRQAKEVFVLDAILLIAHKLRPGPPARAARSKPVSESPGEHDLD
jgi:hypothetical protein